MSSSPEPTPKVQAVVVTSIPGTRISVVCNNIVRHGFDASRTVVRFDVEDRLRAILDEDATLRVAEERRGKLTRPYNLPLDVLSKACKEALRRTMADVRNAAEAGLVDLALVTLHPVFFHQLTRSFLQVYQPHDLFAAADEYAVSISTISTIHDDIYDVYSRLLSEGKIFDPVPRKGRMPRQDITEIMILLDWRDRQLTADRAMAAALGKRHFLFHRKGRVRTFWDVAVEGKACIYVSHAISQVRRDWSGKPAEGKCKVPSESRGTKLMEDIIRISDNLGESFAIVEPTCIDELRIDVTALDKLTVADLEAAVLPPLTRRWEIKEGRRLDQNDERPGTTEHAGARLVNVAASVFKKKYDRLKKEAANPEEGKAPELFMSLAPYKEAVRLLAEELERQITVRDYALAEQADLVVAIRPYSNEEFPELPRGVEKEVTTMRTREAQGTIRFRPSIVAYHPPGDESRRRSNEFEQVFEERASKYDLDAPDKTSFELKLRTLMVQWPAKKSSAELRNDIERLMVDEKVSVEAIDEGSMKGVGSRSAETARDELAKELAESTISFERALKVDEGTDKPLVQAFQGDPFGVELVSLLKKILEEGKVG